MYLQASYVSLFDAALCIVCACVVRVHTELQSNGCSILPLQTGQQPQHKARTLRRAVLKHTKAHTAILQIVNPFSGSHRVSCSQQTSTIVPAAGLAPAGASHQPLSTDVHIFVRKVRHKTSGMKSDLPVELRYDRMTGRYSDPHAPAAGGGGGGGEAGGGGVGFEGGNGIIDVTPEAAGVKEAPAAAAAEEEDEEEGESAEDVVARQKREQLESEERWSKA